jgi:RimJ/RimL family protein N-acetyltransferase
VGGSGGRAHGCLHGTRSHGPGRIRAPLVPDKSRRDHDRHRVIVVDGEVAGTIGSWGDPDEREVTYWIGRSYWGKGIATVALNAFLTVDPSRPLHARVASDNVASCRVLEKCGLRVVATERSFAQARSGEIEELVLRLEESGSA